jgi:hypothetical protein
MAGNTEIRGGWRGSRWRIAAWSIAAGLLLLPLFAMQVTDEVVWNLADFAVAAALVVGVGVTYELAVRITGNRAYRAAVGVALAASSILIWMNLAVGIIGTENNPANLMYAGVLGIGIVGAVIARFQPYGMAGAMMVTALAQTSVAMIAVIAGMGHPASPPLEIFGVNALFVGLWLISARLFWKSAREQASADGAI